MLRRVFVSFCFLNLIFFAKSIVYKEPITDFTKCMTEISRSVITYSKFYEIDKTKIPENDALFLDFHFSALGSSNAHILFAEKDILTSLDPVYEIVLGAGSNTFCNIRRLQKGATKIKTLNKDEMSAIEIRSFWIHVWNDGLIEVGRETEELAFISWRDPDPLNLKFFSFSSWKGVDIKWFFNCERNITKGSTVILTNTQKLEHDLFKNYSIFTRPVLSESSMTNVDLNLTPQHISLDDTTSKISVKGSGFMKWRDEKLFWNPKDYNGIMSLKLRPFRIWTPDLRLHDYKVNLQNLILFHNGSVSSSVLLDLETWCNLEDLSSWPSDVHTCSLGFHFDRDSDKIKLKLVIKQFTLPSSSQWTVTNVNVRYGQTDENLDSFDDEPPNITFLLTLKRTSSIYKIIFLTPFFVISICSLMTFWASPFTYLKIVLCCLQLIMESLILIAISNIIPGQSNTVPTLVALYSGSLIGTVVLVIISIIVINLGRNNYKKYSMPDSLYYILSSNLLQNMLFLSTTVSDTNQYGTLPENLTTSKDDTDKCMWVLLGKVIDRVGFVIYAILFIFAIAQKY